MRPGLPLITEFPGIPLMADHVSPANGVEWLTYETVEVDFALSEGWVFAFMIHKR